MPKFLLLTLTILSVAATSRADNLLSLGTVRAQSIGNCWAYAGANMAESRYETLNGRTILIDLGRDLQRLNIYERFMAVYDTKQKFSGGPINSVGGYVPEYMVVLQKYGLPVLDSVPVAASISYQFPTTTQTNFRSDDAEFDVDEAAAEALESRLINEKMFRPAAEALVRDVLMKSSQPGDWDANSTTLFGQGITRSELYGAIVDEKERPLTPADPLAIMVVAQEDNPTLQVGPALLDDVSLFVLPKRADILSLVRFSLDHGYSASFETDDHARAFLGYKTVDGVIQYAWADSNIGIMWGNDLDHTEQEYGEYRSSTFFYAVVKDQLQKFVPAGQNRGPVPRVSGIKIKYF